MMTEKQQTWQSLRGCLEQNKSLCSSNTSETFSKIDTEKSPKTKIQTAQIEPSAKIKKSIPKEETETKKKPLPKNVRQIEHVMAGNKNNAYRVPSAKKTKKDSNTSLAEDIVRSKQVQATVRAADRGVGKLYRKAKKISAIKKNKPPKITKSQKYAQGYTQEIVPVKEIKYGIIKTTTGMYVKILEILPIDYYSFTPSQKNKVISNYRQIFENTTKEIHLKVINDTNNPKRITEYIKQRCEEEKYQRGIDDKVVECAQDRINFINELCQEISITSRYFLIYKYEGKSDDINEIFAEMESMKVHFTNVFRLMGNTVIEHDSLADETFATADILYYYLNRTTYREESLQHRINRIVSDCSFYNQQHSDKRDVYDGDFLAPKGAKFIKSDHIFQDGMYKTWFALKRDSHPSEVEAAWVDLFTSYGAGNELDIYIKKLPRETALYLLGKKADLDNEIAKYKMQSSQKWREFAPKLANTKSILSEMENGEDLFEVTIIITLASETIKGLRFLKSSILKGLASKKLYVEDAWQYTYDYYKATLPLMEMPASLFARTNHNYLTSSLQSLYPFTSFELCDTTGTVLGVKQHSNTLVAYNPFNTKISTNANIIITGGSGSGKTYSTEVLARSMRITGIRTMFILPVKGYEYERGCKAIGGSFIRIGPGKKDCINIMEIRPEQSIDRDMLTDNIAYSETSLLAKKTAFITTFIQLLNANQEFTPEIYSLMSSVITNLYGQFNITSDNNSIWEDKRHTKLRRMPVISDLYNAFMEHSMLESCARILLEFINGQFKNFNGQTNVDLNNNYLCFDVDEQDMQKKYLPACLYIAFDVCYSLVKQNRLSKDMIFFDEVWKMLITESAAEQVRDMAKLIRGYGGGVAFATQEINDFMNSSYGASVMANCDTRLVMKLNDNEISLVSKHILLTEDEKDDIMAFHRGQALFLAGNNRIRIDIKASKKEDRDFTTDPNKRKQYAEEEARMKRDVV